MNEPLVSVVIPAYNRADVLPRAIRSVSDNSFNNLEIIICDDCSTDNTVRVATALAADDDRIKIIQLQNNQGAAAARNAGMLAAQGKYIAFLDSDDEWLPGKLKKQVNILEASPDSVGLCLTGAKIIKNQMRVGYDIPSDNWEKDPLVALVNGELSFTTSTVMFRRECIEKVGLMVLNLRRGQDEEFIMRIFMHYGLVTIPDIYVVMHLTTYGKRSFVHMITKLNFMLNAHYNKLIQIRGGDVAENFKAKLYYNIITSGLCEREYYKTLKYIYDLFKINSKPSWSDVKSIFKSFLHGIYHWNKY